MSQTKIENALLDDILPRSNLELPKTENPEFRQQLAQLSYEEKNSQAQ